MNNDNPPVPSDPNHLTPAEQVDHDRSVHDYPNINFSPSEYVVIEVQRSIWGLIRIWAFALVVFIAMGLIVLIADKTSPIELSQMAELGLLLLAVALPLLIGLIGSSVYRKNRFIVTNERIHAYIQYSPFAKRMQIIELEHIEDCSYSKSGILQSIFDYGSIRLSTVSDEQTYLFTFVDHPRQQFAVINRVVNQADEGQSTRAHK